MRKYQPYSYSGKSYSFERFNEGKILDHLRHWGKTYFQNHTVILPSMYTMLNEIRKEQNAANEPKEFDLLVKIVKVFEKDESSYELRLKDSSNQ